MSFALASSSHPRILPPRPPRLDPTSFQGESPGPGLSPARPGPAIPSRPPRKRLHYPATPPFRTRFLLGGGSRRRCSRNSPASATSAPLRLIVLLFFLTPFPFVHLSRSSLLFPLLCPGHYLFLTDLGKKKKTIWGERCPHIACFGLDF